MVVNLEKYYSPTEGFWDKHVPNYREDAVFMGESIEENFGLEVSTRNVDTGLSDYQLLRVHNVETGTETYNSLKQLGFKVA